MRTKRLNLIVIAGPNGAGKSTTASSLLKGTLEVTEFVNADLIAQGLSGFQPEGAVFHAGRVMLERIHYLAKKRVDFAFETTLASRTFAPWIAELLKTGYAFHLVFLWLPNKEFAVERGMKLDQIGFWSEIKLEIMKKRIPGTLYLILRPFLFGTDEKGTGHFISLQHCLFLLQIDKSFIFQPLSACRCNKQGLQVA
jgi:hypothetical protein